MCGEGLGRWQGADPRWWAELGEPKLQEADPCSPFLVETPGGRPSLWVWWRHLGQICPCPAQLLAHGGYSVFCLVTTGQWQSQGKTTALSLGPGLLLRPCTTSAQGSLTCADRQTHLIWGHADFWQPIAGDASSYDWLFYDCSRGVLGGSTLLRLLRAEAGGGEKSKASACWCSVPFELGPWGCRSQRVVK